MKYYLIAGEASGDMHGSNLMKGLSQADSQADFRFWGGEMMARVGGTLVVDYKENAVMGFVEVISHLGRISANLSLARKDILQYRPDVLILIDYPGFNLKIAKFARKHGLKVFYYISPKVWAWKESRLRLLKKYVDKLFIIFPFEVSYFKEKGIDALYFGNPLIDRIAQSTFHNHSEGKPYVALLAGSRKLEINFLLPKMVEASRLIGSEYDYLLAAAPGIDISYYERFIQGSNIKVIADDTYSVIKYASAAIVSSGTASLETAIIGTPQVVGYGGNPISYIVARHLIKIHFISLANLIVDRLIFKELIQNECTPQHLAAEVKRLLEDKQYISQMKQGYKEVTDALGAPGASLRVAKAMVDLIKTN